MVPSLETNRSQSRRSTARIFISYSRQDAPVADKLAETLNQFNVWVVHGKFGRAPRENLQEAVEKNLDECNVMIALLSPEAVKSKWVQHEINYALFDKDYKNRVFPVVTDPSKELPDEAPWFLKSLQCLYFDRQKPSESATEIATRILEAIE